MTLSTALALDQNATDVSTRAGNWRAAALVKGAPMEKDLVCGMQVDPATAAGSSQYGGKTYYFCSTACKAKFDANPRQFVK